jgi:TolB-like protein/tRNA A-37 threonylcarbamoyl transferase component Bud32
LTDLLDRLRSTLGERYAIERQIGEGGMAIVYRAKDLKHERTVAIKVLRQELAVSLGADRFLREIRVAANLQHPNILGLYDSGEMDGLLFYVMPFIEGESLRDRLNKEQQLPLTDALQIVRESADALQYAHDRGIVHRDIKPENILLMGGHALVADFGIARAVSQAGGEKLTQTGMAIGTPHYMSPEQSLGSEHVDARSDIYSLGCVLYELLIGQPPFTGPNSMAIMARHSMEVVPSLQVVRASVPDEVEDAVMQALEKTPADRFQTMKELAERLSEAEAEAAMMRTAQRRASTAARRASGQRTAASPRRTGSREAPVERRTPVERVRAAAREGGVKFWSLATGGLLLLAGLGFGGWKLMHRSEAGTAGGSGGGFDANHIAVLYFDQRGGSDSLGYLADGLTEALIHELGQVSQLQVISRNGVLPYKKAAVPPDSIARALRVGTLVEGTVAQAGDRLRVNVSLINASTGAEIGSKILERPREEIFALQDDLAKEVSIFLRQQLGAEIEVAQSRAGTSSVAAWEALQKGLAETKDVERLVTAGDTAAAGQHYEVADSLLRQAEQLDPKWQAPPTQRGWLAYRRGRLLNSVDKASNAAWTGKALEHADRALQLKPNDADALELKGTLAYWRWLLNLEPDPRAAAKLLEEAEKDFRAAVDVNPDQASAWNSLSHLLINKSQMAEAKLAAMRAYESDPYLSNADLTIFRLFTTSVDLGDATEATKWCNVGHQRFPSDPSFTECQLWLLFMEGQKPEISRAWELLGQYVQLNPPDSREYERHRAQMIVAAVIARAATSGGPAALRDSARAVILRSRLDATADPTRELALWEAIARTGLGDKDDAFSQLSVYLATNPQQRTAMAKEQTWYFKDLRSDARWGSLIGASR